MSTKYLSAAFCLFMGATALPAQTTVITFQKAEINEANLGNLIDLLTQNALAVLLSMALIMSIAWLFYIWKACAYLNKKNRSLFTMLGLLISLSFLGSSCTATQQTRVTDIRSTQELEGAYCVCHAPFYTCHRPDYAGVFHPNALRYHTIGMSYCRHCGLRIYKSSY